MHSAECQAAAVVADHFTPAAASGPARLVDSGQAVQDFIPLPADSDQAPASVPLVRGLPDFHRLLHRTGHFHREASHRGPLYPADMCS
jgi:hypothetical protein